MKVCSSYSIFSPAWAVFCVSDIGYFDWYKLSKLPPTCVSLFEHYLLRSLFYWVICFLYLQFLGTYYVWNINALLDMKLVKFFPQSLACHFVKLKYLLSYRNFSVAWGINFFLLLFLLSVLPVFSSEFFLCQWVQGYTPLSFLSDSVYLNTWFCEYQEN